MGVPECLGGLGTLDPSTRDAPWVSLAQLKAGLEKCFQAFSADVGGFWAGRWVGFRKTKWLVVFGPGKRPPRGSLSESMS